MLVREHPVLKAIMERRAKGCAPGRRQDGFKIALVIEGGAMRGVVSCGMVAGLQQLGLLSSFDVVYGTSAGAINGAYFVAGQSDDACSIYYDSINNSQFMTPLRLLYGGPLVSLEFLFEHVMIKEKPLDWTRVLNSPIDMVPVATSSARATAVLLRGARSRYDLFLRLKASARIPCLAGPPVRIDGEDYLDGGLCAPVPVRQALEEHCTHVLALLTRPVGAQPCKPHHLYRYLSSRKLGNYNPLLRDVFLNRGLRYARELDWLEIQTCAATSSPYVYAVRPRQGVEAVRPFEMHREVLVSGANAGFCAIVNLFRKDGLPSSPSDRDRILRTSPRATASAPADLEQIDPKGVGTR